MNFFAVFILITSFIFSNDIRAAPPNLQTPAPVIHLADNLDEDYQLGWCIDTKGRGFSDKLHAHSCKPRGGDVQFSFDRKHGLIKSATFDNKCLAGLGPDLGTRFGLIDCKKGSPFQSFKYISSTQEFRSNAIINGCIAVGKDSRSAGPFMARDLYIADCQSVEPKFRKWIIKED
jgi:hypothetical protein